MNCYESFFDYEVEETGECGYGVSEYSVMLGIIDDAHR